MILYSHFLPGPINSKPNRFGNHRAKITENNSKIVKLGSVIILCVRAYVFVLNLNSLAKMNFHVCIFVSVIREIPQKGSGHVHQIQI